MGKLRVGLVGCGHIAGVHVRAWNSTGTCEIAGAFDINPESAKAFALKHDIPQVFDRVDQLAESVDVVDDCSPPAVHASVAMEAVSRGKDYLVEKPMVLSTSDLEKILEQQGSSGSRICVIHNLKYNLGVQAARKWVDEGRIGHLLSLERHFLTDPTTDRMLRGENHWSHRLPGGRWVETLPHELYLVYHFMGPLDVEHVQSLKLPDSPHPHTADEMMVTLQGAQGIASLRFSARCRGNLRTLTIFGSEGSIRVELLAGTAVLYKPRTQKWVRGVGLDTLNAVKTLGRMVPDRFHAVSAQARRDTAHARLIRDYAAHLTEGGPAPVTLEEIEYVVRTGEEISRQAASSTAPREDTLQSAGVR